jgi:hypothetical protein
MIGLGRIQRPDSQQPENFSCKLVVIFSSLSLRAQNDRMIILGKKGCVGAYEKVQAPRLKRNTETKLTVCNEEFK